MKDYKRIASRALEIAVFFFAAFGGFLVKIAPPDQTDASYDVGVMSFFVLIVLLTISAASRGKQTEAIRRRWTFVGIGFFLIAMPGVLLYRDVWEANTYSYPPERPLSRHVRGSDADLTPLALRWVREHPGESSPAELEANLPYDQIWKVESIAGANRRLLLSYGWVVLSLATAIFCLVEANSSHLKSRR